MRIFPNLDITWVDGALVVEDLELLQQGGAKVHVCVCVPVCV